MEALRLASERTGIPVPDLLRACLRQEDATITSDYASATGGEADPDQKGEAQ